MKVTKNQIEFEVKSNGIKPDFWTHSWIWGDSHYQTIEEISHFCQTYVDVGAWIGPYTLFAARFFKKVLSFEPDKIAYEELLNNIALNGYSNIETKRMAIADYNGELELGVGPEPMGCSQTSFLYNNDRFKISCATLRKVYETNNLSTNTFLKIDIEGGEYCLFDDVEFYATNKPYLFVELHFQFLNGDQKQRLLNGLDKLSKYYSPINGELLRQPMSHILLKPL